MTVNASNAPAAARSGAGRQPRWHHLYYVLAAFDLLTVMASLLLSHRIMGIYSDSVRENQDWADRLGRYARLAEAAGDVNAPGNDVFDSHDVPAERERMRDAMSQFHHQLAHARAELAGAKHGPEAADLSRQLDSIETAMGQMCAEAELIFSYFSNNESEKAGSRMATMDRKFGVLTAAIASLQHSVHQIQAGLFSRQLAQAEALRTFEYAIAAFIVLMIAGVTIYGHKLAASVRAAEALRRKSEQERRELFEQLVDTSRRAGMAEVATGVLHNVGNVLNSVNVSASVVREKVTGLRFPQLSKAVQLIEGNRNELGRFFSEDAKGRQIPEYLLKLSGTLANDQRQLLDELTSLQQGIDHIKQVISMQQGAARRSTLAQPTSPRELIEDALRMAGGMRQTGDVRVEREIDEIDELMLDKHKILQILINMITNAHRALRDVQGRPRLLTIRVRLEDSGSMVRFEVEDNGVGISAADLAVVFQHGFTTRKDGHGFGLHSAANAAAEMDGTLSAHSDGVGRGARFSLRLPARATANV